MRHRAIGIVLVAWALIYSREGDDWSVVDEFATQSTCMQVRSASVDREIQDEIGSALASQPADNPHAPAGVRPRVARRVAARYRCS